MMPKMALPSPCSPLVSHNHAPLLLQPCVRLTLSSQEECMFFFFPPKKTSHFCLPSYAGGVSPVVDVFVYDPSNRTWSRMTSFNLTVPRYQHVASVMRHSLTVNYFFIIGGHNGTSYLSSIDRFNTDGDHVSPLADATTNGLSMARASLAGGCGRRSCVVAGGR